MKSFATYLSKYLVSFTAFIVTLLLLNILIFVCTFHNIMTDAYDETTPSELLPKVATASSEGISVEMKDYLSSHDIWAMYLNSQGSCLWSVNLPEELPATYTIQEVAVFSKGYLADYPVFVWSMDDGLLVLGYPQDSYFKFTRNYYPVELIRIMPGFFAGMLVLDLFLLFFAYFFSKRSLLKNTAPLTTSIQTLANGKPVSLSMKGELAEIADSINKASLLLSRQNTARANWISGVSHDIRTPLSMIMGYAERISTDRTVNPAIQEQASIIQSQSIRIKELIQDLNLVSQLEYDMQPLHKQPIRMAKLLRSYAADMLNAGLPDRYSLTLDIAPNTDYVTFECDERLLNRAIHNLVQNSIHHNPQGCDITLSLVCSSHELLVIVEDNGIGLSAEKQSELEEKPHYMCSTDERLDLRHGLGLLIVRQITTAHHGTLLIESEHEKGYRTSLIFPIQHPEF